MPTALDQLRDAFKAALASLDLYDADPLVVPTTNPAFGDYQCNAAMAAAKKLKRKPRDVAAMLVERVGDAHGVAGSMEIAGPGFINVTLALQYVDAALNAAAADARLGIARAERPLRTVIDYPSPNVAKELHIGHLRPSTIGDALARVLAFAGHDLVRQNHVGDWGTAFGMLLAYVEDRAGDAVLSDIEKFYKAAKARYDAEPAFADAARRAVVRLQAGQPAELERWRRIMDTSRRHTHALFARLGLTITPADERGESFYNPLLPGVVADLIARGVAEPSDGAVVVWVKPFSTPLIVQKSDGGFGYGTTDLAALRYRTGTLNAERLVYVTDARQKQHFQQFSDAGRRAGYFGDAAYDHVMFGTIMGADGKPIKTKSGESVKLADVLDEAVARAEQIVTAKNPDLAAEERHAVARAVGIGALKYADLNKDRLSDYVFDWDTMLAMDGNTAPYLQYAYARVRSIFRRAGDSAGTLGPVRLVSPEELSLGKHVLRLADVLADVTRDLKPHVLCQYLFELAAKFSTFFEACPVLKSEEPTRSSRLALCDLTARTLALGLDLLGIEHPERM